MQTSCIQRRTRAVLVGSLLVGYATYLGGFFSHEDSGDIRYASKALLYDKLSPFQDASLQDNSLAEAPMIVPVSHPVEPVIDPRLVDGTVTHIVGSGETLSDVWAKFGSCRDGGIKAAEAFRSAKVSCSSLRAGEKITLRREQGDIVGLERKLADGATLALNGDSKTGYTSVINAPKIKEEERTISGLVFNSFSASASEAGLPIQLVDDFVDLFGSRVEFSKDFQPGDTFSVVYQHRETEDGIVLKPGAIKAASMKLGSKFFASIRHEEKGSEPRYFDEKGQMPGNFFLRYPLQFTRISSVFSTARFHPILNKARAHNGVDFSAPTGTPVRSIGSGTVIFSGFTKSTGYMVRIRHSDKYTTEYMHLSRISPDVKEDSAISRGQLIGNVGSTGMSTGPHLHFGLFDEGNYVDPMKAKLPEITNGGSAPAVVLATLRRLEQQHSMLALNRESRSGKQHA